MGNSARDDESCDFGRASGCEVAMAWYRVGDGKEPVGALMGRAGPPCWPVQ